MLLTYFAGIFELKAMNLSLSLSLSIYIYIYVCVCVELCVTVERSSSQETLEVSFYTNSIHCVLIAPFLDSFLCLLMQFKASHNVICRCISI